MNACLLYITQTRALYLRLKYTYDKQKQYLVQFPDFYFLLSYPRPLWTSIIFSDF